MLFFVLSNPNWAMYEGGKIQTMRWFIYINNQIWWSYDNLGIIRLDERSVCNCLSTYYWDIHFLHWVLVLHVEERRQEILYPYELTGFQVLSVWLRWTDEPELLPSRHLSNSIDVFDDVGTDAIGGSCLITGYSGWEEKDISVYRLLHPVGDVVWRNNDRLIRDLWMMIGSLFISKYIK